MRHFIACGVIILLPVLAVAQPLKEGKDWRYCSTDDQCVVVEGLCDKTAVNWQVEREATAFYNQERSTAKCVERFWRVGEKRPRCHLGGCEMITKQASDIAPPPSH